MFQFFYYNNITLYNNNNNEKIILCITECPSSLPDLVNVGMSFQTLAWSCSESSEVHPNDLPWNVSWARLHSRNSMDWGWGVLVHKFVSSSSVIVSVKILQALWKATFPSVHYLSVSMFIEFMSTKHSSMRPKIQRETD